ncbi:MAG: hypothetical protein LC647_13790 [Beggiatoa sp.]|nr:hypothetical protein [Beggiatoa sp.]
MDEARNLLGKSERGVTAFLREYSISYQKIGSEVAISQAEFEAALELVKGAGDIGIREAARELVARARAEQGLPPKIKDPTVIGRVVALLQPVVED